MSVAPPPLLLRPGVLDGRTVAVAGGADRAAARCAALGAAVPRIAVDLLDEDAVAAAVAAVGAIDALLVDADTPFRAAGGGLTGLRHAVDGAWNVTRAVARTAWIDRAGGAVALLGPAPDAGAHAAAVRAALENTARTLSTEWARYGITPTAVLPGAGTTDEDVAELLAFLASPAGAYYSGCAFTLGAV